MTEPGTKDPLSVSPRAEAVRRFFRDGPAVAGLVFIILLTGTAVCAPLIANGRPFLTNVNGFWQSPALKDFFAPDCQEILVESLFNFLLLALPVSALFLLLTKRLHPLFRRIGLMLLLAACMVPFLVSRPVMDKTDWRSLAEAGREKGCVSIFAPVPFGPYETASEIYAKPSRHHLFGTDQIGRDVFARMVYGARVSLAVGFLATGLSLFLGTLIGLFSGYRGGRIDLFVQRLVEIVICFPTFLLLLILMALMLDYGSRQSILLVIAVLGFTGWPGLCRLVRGEVLKQREMAYIRSCESMGLPLWRILALHLLPNAAGPIFVSCAFDVAGAILAENSLSFLGFGVQDPSASWGELLREAFADPLTYWNLMLWPGLAIFLTVTSFNFMADGIRKAIGGRT